MDVTQRRLLKELNCFKKNTYEFFYIILMDPIISLPLIAILGYSPFPVGCYIDRPKDFNYGNESEIKQSEHIRLNV